MDEDFRQFCCLELWKHQMRYDPSKAAIGTYLDRRAQYLKADYIRQYKPDYWFEGSRAYNTKKELKDRYFTTEYDTSEYDGSDDPSNKSYVWDTASVEDDLSFVEVAEYLEGLPERTKRVIFQYVFLGLTLEEVGEIHGLTGSRVWQIITRLPKENLKSLPTPQTDIPPPVQQGSLDCLPKPSRAISEISFVKLIRAA